MILKCFLWAAAAFFAVATMNACALTSQSGVQAAWVLVDRLNCEGLYNPLEERRIEGASSVDSSEEAFFVDLLGDLPPPLVGRARELERIRSRLRRRLLQSEERGSLLCLYGPEIEASAVRVADVQVSIRQNTDWEEEPGENHQRPAQEIEAFILFSETQLFGSGTLDENHLDLDLSRYRRHIALCYGCALAGNPQLGGRLVIQFTIGTDGRVDSVRLAANDIGSATGACIETRVRRWRFETPSGGRVTVQQVYMLKPTG